MTNVINDPVFTFNDRRDVPLPDEAYTLFEEGVAYIWRRCDILYADLTPWRTNVGIIDGSINVDGARAERRSGDIVLDNYDGDIPIDPVDGFWYDKVIRVWRGVAEPLEALGVAHAWLLGTFMPDRISKSSSKDTISVSFRDFTKKMMTSKLSAAISFPAGTDIAELIKALAYNSGILKVLAPPTGKLTGREFVFEQDTARWDIINELVNSYALEAYCDVEGGLVVQDYTDPLTSPTSLRLVGHSSGVCGHGYRSNIGSYDQSSSDERMYNHVVVKGESTDGAAPVSAEAENNEPTSPTRIERIGRRTYTYASKFIETEEQARETAEKFLGIHALEQFEVSTNGIVYPYIEANTTIEFHDEDDGTTYVPLRFLLKNFSIPLGLGDMNCAASRVSIIGSRRRWSGSGEGDLVVEGIGGRWGGNQRMNAQQGIITLEMLGDLTFYKAAQVGTLALTGVTPGKLSFYKENQVGGITITGQAGTVTGGLISIFPTPGDIALTAVASAGTPGNATVTAQVGTFTLSAVAGAVS